MLADDSYTLDHDALLAPFHAAESPRGSWRVGTEAEKIGVRVADGGAVPFEGDAGVRFILKQLAERHGWTPYRETKDGEVIALLRGGASITLEPGGQLELSGAPLDTVHQTCSEVRGHIAELRQVSDPLGVAWLGLGYHPIARQADLPWVPKLRYGVMREYMPTVGGRGLDMMRRTATVQANFDYASEADAVKKVRVSLGLSPVFTAIFANSPFVEGRATGERSHRAGVWLDVDPHRTGLLPFAWDDSFGYAQYVEWALDAPMYLVKRGDTIHHNRGQPFRTFLAEGFDGLTATLGDWRTHINTLFPEVRLKSTIELRGCDSQSVAMTCAMPALAKGLLYDETALDAAEALVSGLDPVAAEAERAAIGTDGLSATYAGRAMADWAGEILEIAEAGLGRIGSLNGSGNDERIHLAPVRALLEKGQTPADALLEGYEEGSLLPHLLENARL